ncbi:DUF2934 domain-containing protein [Oryzifoliimicrobium ureilyticus]|uniref:DUF2934 domain-containing protein n=1 Tax=Oryzifoliimicrobium ureilyticus TaxID=3113724 RepID=UPI003076194A
MANTKNDWICRRAYAIWEEQGRPEGRGDVHWRQAAEEYAMLEHTRASTDGSELLQKLKDMGRLMQEAGNRATTSSQAQLVLSRARK